MASAIKITECPRDAMQGLTDYIPASIKAAYINLLLKVGFDTIDFGSFVSPKAIPQMRDTAEVLKRLDLGSSTSKLLAIVANYRGAEEAVQYEEITYLGFPFSISETFQRRNANAGIQDAFITVERIRDLCSNNNKELLIYLSMGFGNPYGDDWTIDLLTDWAGQMISLGIKYISIADTTGIATAAQIKSVMLQLRQKFNFDFGLHLHSTPDTWRPKIEAAYQNGCTRFDTALKGYGGCPMAKDELTGNIATENVISYLLEQKETPGLDLGALQEAMDYSACIFSR
jgi:hydroxymethylglutaryl-CoA lyase